MQGGAKASPFCFTAFVGVARRPAVVVSFDQQLKGNEQLEVLIYLGLCQVLPTILYCHHT